MRHSGLWIAIYPIVAHVGLWTSSPRLVIAYLLALILYILLYPPGYTQLKNSLFAVLVCFIVVILVNIESEQLLIYLPPIIIPTVLMVLFLRSLAKDQIPLITQFEQKMSAGELDAPTKVYTRYVTQLWVIVFAIMIAEAIGLALWTSIEVWSWFTHIGNYALIALVVSVEFIYRHYRFHNKNPHFKQFVIALVKYRWK